MTGGKPKLHLLVGGATHFVRWERPHFAAHFELIDEPRADAVLLAFGPDVLEQAATLPAARRVALLFPGFGCNPYHNLEYRRRALAVIDRSFDLVFVNPGPLQVAYRECTKLAICDFSVDSDLVRPGRTRRSLDSLIHVSADYPQKDWERSAEVMRLTGLRSEVFPPRVPRREDLAARTRRRINRVLARLSPFAPKMLFERYVEHHTVVRKYNQYDGFVHVAAPVEDPLHLDGKYTACLMEAGLTGAILFWHDSFDLGNDLETVFSLPRGPWAAARRILEIRAGLDVLRHSRRTREEILDRFDPARSVGARARRIKEIL